MPVLTSVFPGEFLQSLEQPNETSLLGAVGITNCNFVPSVLVARTFDIMILTKIACIVVGYRSLTVRFFPSGFLVLQALFRPVSMCIPDLALICEIMLMAEGFQQSKPLSRKFVILYKLCEDLLSKSQHYDWKLRAIKTTLTVAGGMKRAAPELSEDKVGTFSL